MRTKVDELATSLEYEDIENAVLAASDVGQRADVVVLPYKVFRLVILAALAGLSGACAIRDKMGEN